MKLKTIKTEAEVRAAIDQFEHGRKLVELTVRDGTVRSIRIGGLHVGGTYGIEVSAEVPHEETARYRVTASIKGMEPRVEFFDDYSKARDFEQSFDPSVETKIDSDIKVLVDDDGKVVKDLSLDGGPVNTVADEELTF